MGYVEELLAPGERVMHRTYRHWIVLLGWAGGGLALAVLGAVMAGLFGVGGAWEGLAGNAGATVGLVLAGVGLLVALPGILRWKTEVYLVTDRRVIQVEGILRKHALDSGLGKVNDVRRTQSLLGRLLGYGTLEIITASESGINRLDQLPHPMAFKRAMMAAVQGGEAAPAVVAASRTATPPGDDPVGRSAAERLAELEELRQRGMVDDAEYQQKRAEILRSV
jgi:uncharacterized membrane protein YdbT with pleckstrin-like domain